MTDEELEKKLARELGLMPNDIDLVKRMFATGLVPDVFFNMVEHERNAMNLAFSDWRCTVCGANGWIEHNGTNETVQLMTDQILQAHQARSPTCRAVPLDLRVTVREEIPLKTEPQKAHFLARALLRDRIREGIADSRVYHATHPARDVLAEAIARRIERDDLPAFQRRLDINGPDREGNLLVELVGYPSWHFASHSAKLGEALRRMADMIDAAEADEKKVT